MRSDQQAKKQINSFLQKAGFGALDDPTLFHQLAVCIRDHEHFSAILMKTLPDKRRLAYESLAPRLRFKAKPLADYELEARLAAERDKLPTLDANLKLIPYEDYRPHALPLERLAEQAIAQKALEDQAKQRLTLVCARCLGREFFFGETKAEVLQKARKAGWVRDLNLKDERVEVCPTCPPYSRTAEGFRRAAQSSTATA